MTLSWFHQFRWQYHWMTKTERLLELTIWCHWSDNLVTRSSNVAEVPAGSIWGHHDIIYDVIFGCARSWGMRHEAFFDSGCIFTRENAPLLSIEGGPLAPIFLFISSCTNIYIHLINTTYGEYSWCLEYFKSSKSFIILLSYRVL